MLRENEWQIIWLYVIDGLMHERRNSIANALELRFLALTHRNDFEYSTRRKYCDLDLLADYVNVW